MKKLNNDEITSKILKKKRRRKERKRNTQNKNNLSLANEELFDFLNF